MLDCKVLRVVDGDTIEVSIDKMKIRLDFLDAPETKGVEKPQGLISKQWLKDQIEGQVVQLDIKEQDTFGRFLSVIYKDDINLNGEMIKKNYAEFYSPKNHNNGKVD